MTSCYDCEPTQERFEDMLALLPDCERRGRPGPRVNSEVDIRGKEQPSKKKAKESEEMWKFRNPKLASMKIVLKCTRNVLRCTNSRWKAIFWN